MAATMCVRESPFTDLSVTECKSFHSSHFVSCSDADTIVYGSSSRTRVTDFNVLFENVKGRRRIFTIDGNGPSPRPLHIIVVEVETSSLNPDAIDAISRVQGRGSPPAIEGTSPSAPPKTITIVDPDVLSSLDLNIWAMEYAYKFTKTHNIHATAFILGIEYVEKKLPHVR